MIALAALQLFDKGKRSADPTFTFDIRRAWRATAQMRLRQLRGRMRIAIIDHDVLALGGADSVMGYHPKATRLNAFSKWLEAMGAQALVSDWSTPYVTKAWQSGVIAAHKQTVATIGAEVDDQDMIVVRVQQELRGIAAALAQQVSREADKVLSMSRPQAFRQLAKIFDKVAVNRLNAMCNTFTVTAHNKAKLAVFRAAGHSHVGVMPESIAGGRKGHSHIRDAFNPDEERNAKGEWTIGSAADIPNAFQLKMIIAGMKPAIKMVRDFQGRKKDEILVGKRGDWHNDVAKANNIKPIDVDYHFGVDGEMPIYERGFVFPWSNTYYSARDIGVDAAELRGAGGRGHASEDSFDLSLVKGNSLMLDRPMSSEEDEDIVGVLTADDDDVCELCENIAADGPYTLDEAYDLIGDTHPNCRCSVYPWGDNQYVGDGIRIDDFDPNEARDPLGMWTAGGESRSADRISTRVFSLTCDGIDTDLDIKADDHSAIGAWADGAENSLMIRMPGATHDEAVIASALKGYTADQKSVLLFEPHATGDAYMAMFKAQGNVDDIHAGLLHDGVAFHTLLPVSDGSVVCIFGSDNETLHAISKAAQRYDASIEFTRGHGEFIGTQKEDGTDREQRDDARQIYATIIQGSIIAGKLRGRDLAATWGKVRAHSAAI